VASLPEWLAPTLRHRRARERPDRVVLDRGVVLVVLVVLAVLVVVRVDRRRQPVRWGRDRMALVVRVGPHRDSDAELIDARAVVRLGGRLEMGHRSSY
jgi:hypothetical protein